jgi:hypothetical protein
MDKVTSVDNSGVFVAVAFSKAFGFVKGSPLDDFVIVVGSIAGVDYNDTTSYQYDINGNIIHKSDIGNYNNNTPSQTSTHAPQSITRPNTNALPCPLVMVSIEPRLS